MTPQEHARLAESFRKRRDDLRAQSNALLEEADIMDSIARACDELSGQVGEYEVNYNTEKDKFMRSTRDQHTGAERDCTTNRLLVDAFDAGYEAGLRISEEHVVARLRKLLFDAHG